jgi:Mg-chelatase subunit ChlD
MPLSEVLANLQESAKKRDPEKKGINFVVNQSAAKAFIPAVDPNTGLPVAQPPVIDISEVPIQINPPLDDVRLADLLDAIVKVAAVPLKYSIEDYGIVFSAKEPAFTDAALAKPATPPPIPQPEIQTSENAFSTFSLNISDVSFKLAAASLEKGSMPEAGSIRSEEFINAFDYRDPEAPAGVPIAFAWERARYPFAQNRDLLRLSLKTAAQGRQPGRPLNLVLLLDNSGSMERADRVQIIREALRVLASQLQPQDTLSVITFARTTRLWVDGVPGNQAAQVLEQAAGLTPQGGTNLEEAMNLGYQTALRHYQPNGINRVVLLTDGAANLGNVEPESLKKKVEDHRKQGIALDCFGIGWEGYNDDLLEVLSRNGDGRYGFINTPDEAASEFAGKLAGALHVAASDVKVQVEFNPGRVTAYHQIGYARHQLTKEQFRDNTVDAAEIGAAESGNALYVIEVNPRGEGPLAIVRVRYKVPGTVEYHEHEWAVPYTGNAIALPDSSPAMRLAATASAFSEWLATSPYAAEVAPDSLLECLRGIPEIYGPDQRPKKLEWMIRQAKSLTGK